MSEPMFYDLAGAPVSLERFLELNRDPANKVRRREQVGRYTVLTAWLGLDESLGDVPVPLIFGTIALLDLDPEHAVPGTEQWAATEADALANHAELVIRLRQESAATPEA